MPYNGSGVFSPSTADFPAVSGTLIQSTKFNNVINDIATGLSTALTKDGQTTVTANLPMAGFKHTGVGNATARDQYATVDQVQDGDLVYGGTAGGTADALTVSTSPAFTAYVTGMKIIFKAGASPNTGAATLQANGIASPKTIQNDGAALVAGDIAASKWYAAIYDGTNFQLWRASSFDPALFLAKSNTWTGTNIFTDGSFRIAGSADATKILRFEVDGFTTGQTRVATPPDYNFRIMSQERGASIASSATLNLDTATGDYIAISGTTTVTAITLGDGKMATLRFAGSMTLTNGASLILPTGANIQTAIGDTAIFRGEASGVVRCVAYLRASGAPLVVEGQGLTLGTEQATTSGTSIDFTSIPSWVKRITVSFDGVSTTGTSVPIVQIGDSGGVEVTGYTGVAAQYSAGPATNSANLSSGFAFQASWAAADTFYGSMTLTRQDESNTWACAMVAGHGNSAVQATCAGTKQLSGTLDRVRLTTVGGTDTFDAGSVNIAYE